MTDTNTSEPAPGDFVPKFLPPQHLLAAVPHENMIGIINHGLLGFKEWDKGVFGGEFERMLKTGSPPKEGTYLGTQKALSELYERILARHESFFDVADIESSVPQGSTLADNKKLYAFQPAGSDKYPPHFDDKLHNIPPEERVPLDKIFDKMRLADVGTLIAKIIPEKVLDYIHGEPDQGKTIAEIEAKNDELHKKKEDMYELANIGNRGDWWTDAIFAQQQFIGTNPTTIEKASAEWTERFTYVANKQHYKKMADLLTAGAKDGSLYIQDCSYFRDAAGIEPTDDITTGPKKHFWSDDQMWGCAAVSLFQLLPDGKLHPLAIITDWKGSIDVSVTIFNNRLSPTDPEEPNDWPWRFAKTCALSSDWTRHEITVHLVNTHMVEEVVIVSAYRSFDPEHVVFKLLQPHWLKTLSLNASARSVLVPSVIIPLAAMPEDTTYSFIKDAYKKFDWVGKYVPNDLAARGFPLEELNSPRLHNYAYARNIYVMWSILRAFVSSVLSLHYTDDAQVAADKQVEAWYQEMRSPKGGQMDTFPEIKTKDQLIDAVTMCIHIAAPQHTAVNYLQEYYQAFVINKPPAFFKRLPQKLDELRAYKESDVVKALPINHPRQWLIAAHLPHLLSLGVSAQQNLPNYALSLYKLATGAGQEDLAIAASKLFIQLTEFSKVVKKHSNDMDDPSVPYWVMLSERTAVSVLI